MPIPNMSTYLARKMKFCSSCSRDQAEETGHMILTAARTKRWICASCYVSRKNRSGSSLKSAAPLDCASNDK